jgi:hypothetical protein
VATMTTDERRELLDVVDRAWADLTALLDSIPDAALERPNTIGHWSGRDMVGHLAGWEAIGSRIIRELEERGEFTRLGVTAETINAFNEDMLAPYRALSTPDVRRALAETHRELMDLAERSPAADAEIVLDVTRDHYNKHVGDLRGCLD